MSERLPTVPGTARGISSFLEDGNAKASATLTAGSIVWKLLSYSEHIDFLLSLREEKFAMIFTFFESIGWLLLAGVGVIWWFGTRVKGQNSSALNWPFVISCIVVAFLFGSLVTVQSSGEIPQVIIGWGGQPTACTAAVDMTKIQSFRSQYRLAVICGIQDPRVDMMEDERILVSNLFDIRPGGVNIVATESKRLDDLKKIPPPVSEWHVAVLLPINISRDKVSKLSDVIALGGKILMPGLYQ